MHKFPCIVSGIMLYFELSVCKILWCKQVSWKPNDSKIVLFSNKFISLHRCYQKKTVLVKLPVFVKPLNFYDLFFIDTCRIIKTDFTAPI